MLDGILEALGVALEVGASDGPRWMRIGCTTLLIVIAVALLTIWLWWPR
jgi:hypothetical protein